MPIYEFCCPICNNTIEIIQKTNDPNPCCINSGCNNAEMIRKISLSNFILKGPGWYKDGYSKKPTAGGKNK